MGAHPATVSSACPRSSRPGPAPAFETWQKGREGETPRPGETSPGVSDRLQQGALGEETAALRQLPGKQMWFL